MQDPFVKTLINNREIERIQIESEFQQLLDIMRQEHVQSVLEIGFWKGGTALGFDKEITGGRITSIDFWAVAEDTAAFLTGNSAFRNHFEFINGHSHRAPTIEAAEKQAPYDMLFIDGGHTYDDVKQDYVNYSGFVRKEGMIVFHDIRLETDPVTGKEGVKRAYWELAEGNFHSELIAPYPDDLPRKEGFGIGIIYKSW